MAKTVTTAGWLVAFLLGCVVFSVPEGSCQGTPSEQVVNHNRQGLEFFKKGYYEHAPRHEGAEAERNFRLAEKEFRAAIAADPASAEPHRNLARLYFLEKNHAGASDEYLKVVELVPDDLDAYVNLALALLEQQRFAEALQALESARARAHEPNVQATLDNYLAKVRARQAGE